MLGPFDYALYFTSLAAEVYVVLCGLVSRQLPRYFSLYTYMLVVALQTIAGAAVVRMFGFTSVEYRYYYYYSDCLLTVFLYLAIMGLYQHVFQEMRVSKYIRVASILLLAATATFSYLVVQENAGHLTGRFAIEMGQNLYFVGVVLTYLLWGAVVKLRETRTRLIQLVLSLGIYFSATAAAFALRNLFPSLEVVKIVQPLAGTFLPLAWAYTFTRIPEEARLATAQVATPHR